MSRTTADPASGRRLPVGLLRGLIDDAAVFPPGCAALSDAVADYRRRQRSPLAAYIGPLLVPVSMAEELAALVAAGAHDGEALPVALIARSGVEPGALGAALAALGADHGPAPAGGLGEQHRPNGRQGLGGRSDADGRSGVGGLGGRLSVVGVELAHQDGWRVTVPALSAAVEVPRGPAGHAALAELARPVEVPLGDAGAGTASTVRAKLRTQSTATDPVPTADELTDFISNCVRLGIGFKLTGGLHHALAHTAAIAPARPADDAGGPGSPGGPPTFTGDSPSSDGQAGAGHLAGTEDPTGTEEQHGVLNVMLATHLALTGAEGADLRRALTMRDAEAVAAPLLDLTPEQVTALRARFTSFGCCGVTDPLTDLAGLDLVDLH